MTALPTDIERLALLRWRLYPASRRSKAACIKDPGASATFDLDKLQAWTREFPDCNWRMVCEGSGVWALDVDVPSEDHDADGVAALADLVKRHSPIPTRPMTRSGGGGLALFFRHSGEPIHGATGWPVPGIDPRRGKLSVTVPPSIHVRTRRPYVWAVAPWEVSPPDAPGWLLPARRAVCFGWHPQCRPGAAQPLRRSRVARSGQRRPPEVKSPRTPGVGVTRALETLGGDDSRILLTPAGSQFNDGRTLCAARLDRQADLWLSVGRHAAVDAEAYRAADNADQVGYADFLFQRAAALREALR